MWDLVNGNMQYRQAVPVLIAWLRDLDERTPLEGREGLRESLVRSLTVPAARPAAAPVLIEQFRQVSDPAGTGIGWVIGNALSVVADASVFDEIEGLVTDRRCGKARQMVVISLGRSKDPRAVPLLLELLADDNVAAHAVMALAKLRPPQARRAIEPLLAHPLPLVRKEARKALARFPS